MALAVMPSEPALPLSQGDGPANPPWMDSAAFPVSPDPSAYGYLQGAGWHPCSPQDLAAAVATDGNKQIKLVGTAETPHLVSPEEVPWLFDAVRARQAAHLKGQRSLALVHLVVWGLVVTGSAFTREGSAPFPVLLLLVLGIIPFLETVWHLHQLRSYTPEARIRQIPAARYLAWLDRQNAPWTWALCACVACVGAVQLMQGVRLLGDPSHSTIAAAGLVKSGVRAGEWWRLLTGTLLHGHFLHFVFNFAALLALGKILEITFHRAYVPLAFLLSALSGSLLSLVLLPEGTSVGASGGIMGLIGLVLVLAWRDRQSLPYAVRRGLVAGVAYTFVAGLLAYQVVDNPGHVGGFLAGVILGVGLTCHRQVRIRDQVSPLLYASGLLAGGILLAGTAWCLLVLLGRGA